MHASAEWEVSRLTACSMGSNIPITKSCERYHDYRWNNDMKVVETKEYDFNIK